MAGVVDSDHHPLGQPEVREVADMIEFSIVPSRGSGKSRGPGARVYDPEMVSEVAEAIAGVEGTDNRVLVTYEALEAAVGDDVDVMAKLAGRKTSPEDVFVKEVRDAVGMLGFKLYCRKVDTGIRFGCKVDEPGF